MSGRATRVVVATCLLLATLVASQNVVGQSTTQQRQTRQQLDEIRERIEKLAEDQHAAEARRDRISNQLIDQARALARAAKQLQASETALQDMTHRLVAMQQERADVQGQLDRQYQALAALLRATYMLGPGSDLRMLLGKVRACPDPNVADGSKSQLDCSARENALARLQRMLAYSRYFKTDRKKKIDALLALLSRKQVLQEQLQSQRQSIAAQRDKQKQQQGTLIAARNRHRQLLNRVEADIAERGSNLAQLHQQREKLEKLVKELQNVFADIPTKLPNEMPFADRRGNLPWPVTGKLRKQDKGVLILVDPGSQVHAVAHGRVAWADWLRGYGMLIIIDHGDGWMSLYGNNESLLRDVGAWVNAGDVIATSGRDAEGHKGTWFGLRHDGRAVQPTAWLK